MGDSGNLAFFLHPSLDPISFLTKSLLFLFPFFFFFFFFGHHKEKRDDSEQRRQLHQLQPHQQGGTELVSCLSTSGDFGIQGWWGSPLLPLPPQILLAPGIPPPPPKFLVTLVTAGSHQHLRDARLPSMGSH